MVLFYCEFFFLWRGLKNISNMNSSFSYPLLAIGHFFSFYFPSSYLSLWYFIFFLFFSLSLLDFLYLFLLMGGGGSCSIIHCKFQQVLITLKALCTEPTTSWSIALSTFLENNQLIPFNFLIVMNFAHHIHLAFLIFIFIYTLFVSCLLLQTWYAYV